MSMTLMHVEYHPTNVGHPTRGFRHIADWLDDRFRKDEKLAPEERAEPRTVNLLANIVIDDEPPMTTDRDGVLRFKELVARTTEGDDGKNAQAAREIAAALAALAEEHDTLHLTLV